MILRSLKILFIVLFCSAYMSFLERKLLALFQNRCGPTFKILGFSQVFADVIKMIFKEDWIPPFVDKFLFIIAPILSFSSLLVVFAIIPMSPNCIIETSEIGILFFIMIAGISVYPILFSGWSSNNKYSSLASIRSVVQTLSFEIFLGISIMGIVMKSNSFDLIEIVNDQRTSWNIFHQFLSFLLFLLSSFAICHRHPFDFPESEQELVAGYHIEYSGMKFSLFFLGEYNSIITVSSLMTTLFFGGWHGWNFFPPYFWFIFKTSLIVFFFILVRASLPRPKHDTTILLGWKICFPLSLLNLILTAIKILCKTVG